MCGINGLFQFNPIQNQDSIDQSIRLMNEKIRHRGPDADGFFVNENIGLAMRRLSIIDLVSGDQPIFNEDKSLVIVFNGEIYNFKEIQKTLVDKGHVFNTHSDTEVILHSYEEYGVDCLNQLEGMFAFAIYDLTKKQLFIARDRIGEKPLYYHLNQDRILFGSELKSLMSLNTIPKELSKIALAQYFQLTYIPAPLTIYEHVYKLPAASYMLVDEQGQSNIFSYWDIQINSNEMIEDFKTASVKLREALFKSVEQRMVSDVPIGAFLSGGIDSTIIVAILSKLSKEPINTFTIGFKEKEYDERQRAQLVADTYKTNHHVYTLDYDEAIPLLDEIIENMDEPFADASIIPTYMVSKYASKYVKVVLTGDAGDELYAGYSKYLIGYYSELYKRIPKPLRTHLVEPLFNLLPSQSELSRKIHKVTLNADKSIYDQRVDLMSLGLKRDEINDLFIDTTIDYSKTLDFIKNYYTKFEGQTDEITQTLYTDLKVVLEGDMLAKVDRSSMLASLETRTPMLDRKLIDLVYQMPSSFKINKKQQKIILKETFKDLIPEELFNASKKGFAVPTDLWLRNQLADEIEKFMRFDYVKQQGIFNPDTIMSLGMKLNFNSKMWAYFIFQKWIERKV